MFTYINNNLAFIFLTITVLIGLAYLKLSKKSTKHFKVGPFFNTIETFWFFLLSKLLILFQKQITVLRVKVNVYYLILLFYSAMLSYLKLTNLISYDVIIWIYLGYASLFLTGHLILSLHRLVLGKRTKEFLTETILAESGGILFKEGYYHPLIGYLKPPQERITLGQLPFYIYVRLTAYLCREGKQKGFFLLVTASLLGNWLIIWIYLTLMFQLESIRVLTNKTKQGKSLYFSGKFLPVSYLRYYWGNNPMKYVGTKSGVVVAGSLAVAGITGITYEANNAITGSQQTAQVDAYIEAYKRLTAFKDEQYAQEQLGTLADWKARCAENYNNSTLGRLSTVSEITSVEEGTRVGYGGFYGEKTSVTETRPEPSFLGKVFMTLAERFK